MFRARKFRMYPTDEQKMLLEQHFGCCRFVYNWAYALKEQTYRDEHRSLLQGEISRMLPDLKKEHPFLAEVNAQSLQQAIKHLFEAYSRFFKHLGNRPSYKSKHNPHQSFTVPQAYIIDADRGTVKLPKIGAIKVKLHRKIIGTPRSLTISRSSGGRYYLSVLVKDDAELPPVAAPIPEQTIGIDLGLKQYATLSTGEVVENPRYLRNSMDRLKVLQRRLSRKQKGSQNRKKARFAVGAMHRRITDQRNDFLHQLSSRLVRENQAIAVESLAISNMVKNHNLAQAIEDAAWGTFVDYIEYKCRWAGKTLLKIGRFDPSTKTCSTCGHHNSKLSLADREWTCPDCGTHHDRDHNAAINIRNFGLAGQELPAEPVDSLPLGRGMKQEAPSFMAG